MPITPKTIEMIHFYGGPNYKLPRIAIETGTFKGSTTRSLARFFEEVLTVELSKHWYDLTSEKLKLYNNIECFYMDSELFIEEIMDYEGACEPVFFYLDAHWFPSEAGHIADETPMPLMYELDRICCTDQPHLIAVDDVHAFGRKDGYWDDIGCGSILRKCGKRVRTSKIIDDAFYIWLKDETK